MPRSRETRGHKRTSASFDTVCRSRVASGGKGETHSADVDARKTYAARDCSRLQQLSQWLVQECGACVMPMRVAAPLVAQAAHDAAMDESMGDSSREAAVWSARTSATSVVRMLNVAVVLGIVPNAAASTCEATLVAQHSKMPCLPGISFGCSEDSRSIWVANCRGRFRCLPGGEAFDCGYPPGRRHYDCSCTAPNYHAERSTGTTAYSAGTVEQTDLMKLQEHEAAVESCCGVVWAVGGAAY